MNIFNYKHASIIFGEELVTKRLAIVSTQIYVGYICCYSSMCLLIKHKTFGAHIPHDVGVYMIQNLTRPVKTGDACEMTLTFYDSVVDNTSKHVQVHNLV